MLKFSVIQRLSKRLHVTISGHLFDDAEAAYVETTLMQNPAIEKAQFFTRSRDLIIHHTGDEIAVRDALLALNDLNFEDAPALTEYSPRLVNKQYKESMISQTLMYLGKKLLLPAPINMVWSWFNALKFAKKAVTMLWHRKLTVEVLDGVAITVSLLRGDVSTAGAVMYLLGIGETLEEWTLRKSVLNLAESMSLNVDKVWVKVDGVEVSRPVSEVVEGDLVVLRQGEVVSLDGVVVEGVVLVNESSMTGEPEPVRRDENTSVYAGTVVEEGHCVIEVRGNSKSSRYEQIVALIEESEQMKSGMEQKAFHMADKLVPISFAGTILTYLLTRNTMKALSFLMVDFSCALKLSIPLAVLSAMEEASKRGITVKGGKYLEQIAAADVVVFDKTGTLTKAEPVFEQIITFEDHDPDDMLMLAACLEEHFPHSMAKAVVNAAEQHNLPHKEKHSSKVEYIVAHGIASKVGNRKCRIGSAHFIFDDEKVVIPEGEQEKFDNLPDSSSHLYLAISGRLAAVLCIKDPVREEAKQVVKELHELGIKKVVMMTGDSKRNAERVAREIGIDEVHAEVLPGDKAAYVKKAKEEGYTVMMVGDGINDSPALSEAHVGVAMNEGAPIAQKIANVTVSSDNLSSLVDLRRIAMQLMDRIQFNYNSIVGVNGALVGLGLFQVLTPSTTAWMHNLFTLGIGLRSMTPLLPAKSEEDDSVIETTARVVA
ncbi:heavy metal translocating P-type ATPase [Veillonella sp. CAG:933]|uniref:heavy metal translocating P-type ATPase n=1 Tax=Veillonella sp. CAG:933 TaxID=1262980 RepID=UPI00033D7556|nr:heavy metal translocating P-type ATPase [Veillonella sp. CAG:933]CCX55817.1 heavy metal translocating P-type ATPase [Veillonella sp. CAG:933]